VHLKYPFDMQRIGGQIVAVPVWKKTPVFEGVVTLNDTGAFIFENLKEDISENELTKRVMENFECSETDASSSVQHILNSLRDAELLDF